MLCTNTMAIRMPSRNMVRKIIKMFWILLIRMSSRRSYLAKGDTIPLLVRVYPPIWIHHCHGSRSESLFSQAQHSSTAKKNVKANYPKIFSKKEIQFFSHSVKDTVPPSHWPWKHNTYCPELLVRFEIHNGKER